MSAVLGYLGVPGEEVEARFFLREVFHGWYVVFVGIINGDLVDAGATSGNDAFQLKFGMVMQKILNDSVDPLLVMDIPSPHHPKSNALWGFRGRFERGALFLARGRWGWGVLAFV